MDLAKRSIERLRLRDGTELHCESAGGGEADAWLVGVHGIGEHLGRERRLAEVFVGRYRVFQYDLRGHGRSGGRRGYVGSFSEHYRDLEEIVTHLASRYPAFRYVLFGHSMGALIAAGFVQRRPVGVARPERVFLASPPVGLGGLGGGLANRLPRKLVAGLSRVSVSVPVASAINRRYISHDEDVVAALKRDPLSLRRLHTKLLLGLVAASRDVFSRPLRAGCPLYGAIGGDDQIVSCEAARRYFAAHEPEAEFRVFPGAYHELHNETDTYREPYFAWLKEALG